MVETRILRLFRRRFVTGAASLAAAGLAGLRGRTGWAAAQEAPYPARPVRVVSPFPPGQDILVRAPAEAWTEFLGQPVVVDNRPGAGGGLAAEHVARSPADGYTLLVGSSDAIVYSFVMAGRPPLDPFRDFVPVGRVMRDHWVIAASPALGVDSVAELVALAKARPGQLNYATPGMGHSFHLQAERFCRRTGIEAVHVPYRDNYVPDLMAGRVAFVVQAAAPVLPQLAAGHLRGLAVLSAARVEALPDVPTIGEAAYPDLVYNGGVTLFAPAGTPPPVVRRLSEAMNRAAETPGLRRRFADLGLETVQSSPEDAVRYLRGLIALQDEIRTVVFGRAR
ncbi:MAG TPA: tripartite tricarboxylate transporter substrate binding protein [Crenalkalicoccus sp.]|nr:tripartite tricarboxylate transporter substrate binding protein [Crenalkalicoccus sp.]